jgi:hypothetical protein
MIKTTVRIIGLLAGAVMIAAVGGFSSYSQNIHAARE